MIEYPLADVIALTSDSLLKVWREASKGRLCYSL